MIKLLILSRVNLRKQSGIKWKIPKEVRMPLMLYESRSILILLLKKNKNRYSLKRWTIKVIYKELPDVDDIYGGLIANIHKVERSAHQTNATWTCTYNNNGNLSLESSRAGNGDGAWHFIQSTPIRRPVPVLGKTPAQRRGRLFRFAPHFWGGWAHWIKKCMTVVRREWLCMSNGAANAPCGLICTHLTCFLQP